MKKGASYIPLLIAILMCALSCGREERFDTGPDSGFGAIELRLDSGGAMRVETKTLADSLKDGFFFNNVLVVLTDNDCKVVGSVYKAYPYVPGVSDLQDAVAETSVMEDVIHFEHLLPGNYQVYAYANIDATEWQDGAISANEKLVSPGDDFTQYLDRKLLSLNSSDTSVPVTPSTKMLLTGQKTIPVGLSVATETVDLLRPVVRVKVTVKNNTPFPVKVDTLFFSGFNPDKAYLLDHSNSSGLPVVPDGATYRELPAYPILSASPTTVRANSDSLVYKTLVYENAATLPYEICAVFSMDRSSESLTPLSVSLGKVGSFGPVTYSYLNSMPVGNHVDVLVINPRITTRAGRLYYGIGANGTAWESCGYEHYDGFLTRARAIYNEEAYTYTEFGGNGVWTNTHGQAGWTGNNSDNPKYDNFFDYRNGVGGSYFRRITKNGANNYTIDGLSTNIGTETSIDGVNIVQGVYPTAGRFPEDLDGSLLVRFTKNNKNLKSDFVYNNNNASQAKFTKLTWDTQNNHDHQFILFGKPDDSGAPLKRILKENNKEVPLTYMSRNEDINIVINVFYADQEGSIDFLVDNSTWDDEHSTTSSHTFN
ncbi:MAG: FimB/Mfa2 family fimbrial subunit [Bacteroidales bacterium]|nr:FimB/Mfa2 family fimbrial subunit [Bacteroidales bacterium]